MSWKESVRVKEYDIFVPLNYNDGSPIEAAKFQGLQEQLLGHFGGLTFFPQPNKGFWKVSTVTYRDEIVIYRVISLDQKAARDFLMQLKEKLRKDFDQEDILIVERNIETL